MLSQLAAQDVGALRRPLLIPSGKGEFANDPPGWGRGGTGAAAGSCAGTGPPPPFIDSAMDPLVPLWLPTMGCIGSTPLHLLSVGCTASPFISPLGLYQFPSFISPLCLGRIYSTCSFPPSGCFESLAPSTHLPP